MSYLAHPPVHNPRAWTGLPSWSVNFVLHDGMSKIFHAMREVALGMAADDPKNEHIQYTRSEAYKPTADWIKGKAAEAIKKVKC